MAERILVTGGSGFIGTHLIDALLAHGHEVLNIDAKSPVKPTHRPCWRDVDLMDYASLSAVTGAFAPTLMFNLAAIADISLGREAMLPNTQGLRNLINIGRNLAARPRLVHTSTQLVVEAGYRPSGDRDYKPYTDYGVSKAESEKILWDEANDYVWTIVRPTTIWGPLHATFPQSTFKYLQRRWYMVPSGSQPVRSYGYVANVVDQMIAAGTLDPKLVDHRIFYVGDEPMQTGCWLDGFSKAMTGKPCRRIPFFTLQALALVGDISKKIGGPAPIDSGRLYRMTTDYTVPMASTFETLGTGSVGLDEGIDRTVEWLRETYPAEFPRRG